MSHFPAGEDSGTASCVLAGAQWVVGLLAVLYQPSATAMGQQASDRSDVAVRSARQNEAGRIMPPESMNPVSCPTCGDGKCDESLGECYGTCPDDCASFHDRVEDLRSRLQTEFEVDEGIFRIFEVEDCDQLERCFFNNPTSPYGAIQLPLGPGEPDPDPENRGLSPPGLRSIYRLLPDEAILWIGTLPPESPYFSFTVYLYSRFNPAAAGDPPYDDRAEIYASLGDSQNNVTLKTSALPGESPFGKESVLIVTGDGGTDATVRRLLDGSGFSASIANTLVIPQFEADGVTPLARLGYDNEADLFNVLARIANPDAADPDSEIRAWLSNPGSAVFRIRPRVPRRLDPIPFLPLRIPGSGGREDSSALLRLVRRIKQVYARSNPDTRVAIVSPLADGYNCIHSMVLCNADCRDTPYMMFPFTLGGEDGALIVAGYNHELSGKARYVNITATRWYDGTAYYSVVMGDLIGSAEMYLPRDPDVSELWQMKFARHCDGEPFCFEITQDQLASNELGAVLVRAYLDPVTGTRPKMIPKVETELVYPRAIYLNH